MFYRLGLFEMIRAAITPGIHPKQVNRATMRIDPQPLSMTASGGKIMESMTRPRLIIPILFQN